MGKKEASDKMKREAKAIDKAVAAAKLKNELKEQLPKPSKTYKAEL